MKLNSKIKLSEKNYPPNFEQESKSYMKNDLFGTQENEITKCTTKMATTKPTRNLLPIKKEDIKKKTAKLQKSPLVMNDRRKMLQYEIFLV